MPNWSHWSPNLDDLSNYLGFPVKLGWQNCDFYFLYVFKNHNGFWAYVYSENFIPWMKRCIEDWENYVSE